MTFEKRSSVTYKSLTYVPDQRTSIGAASPGPEGWPGSLHYLPKLPIEKDNRDFRTVTGTFTGSMPQYHRHSCRSPSNPTLQVHYTHPRQSRLPPPPESLSTLADLWHLPAAGQRASPAHLGAVRQTGSVELHLCPD